MNWNNIGFQLTNVRLVQEVTEEVKKNNPHWNDKKVAKEAQKVLKKATLFNDKNKKVKKIKEVKEPNPKKDKPNPKKDKIKKDSHG